MMVSSRPRLFASFGSVVATALLLVLVALVSTACDDKHIGRKCDLAVMGTGGTSGGSESATINSQAVECPTRICLQAAQEQPTNVGPLCTSECGSDDDCADAQTGAAPLCPTGFKCAIPTTVGDFCCKKMCVCKDFLVIPQGGLKVPPICMPGMNSTCKNVAK